MTAATGPNVEELRARIKVDDPKIDVPPEARPTRCKSCDAMIYFVQQQPSGKLMPVDVLVPGGVVPHPAERDLSDSGSGRMYEAVVGKGVAHFATCPTGHLHRAPR